MKLPKSEEFIERFQDPVWLEIGRGLYARSGLEIGEVVRSEQGESVVLLGDSRYILKIYRPWKRGFEREVSALERLQGRLPAAIPEIVASGEFDGYRYLITTAVPGRLVSKAEWLSLHRGVQVDLIEQLAQLLRALHALDVGDIDFDWPAFIAANAAGAVDRQRKEGGNPEWVESLPDYIEHNLPLVQTAPPHVFLHGDVHFGNIRIVDRNGKLSISGVFDFADSLRGSSEYDFVAPGVLMIQGQGGLQREFFRRYGYADTEINDEMRRRMMMLTILYEFSSLRRYAERLGPGSEKLTLRELEKAIWNFS